MTKKGSVPSPLVIKRLIDLLNAKKEKNEVAR